MSMDGNCLPSFCRRGAGDLRRARRPALARRAGLRGDARGDARERGRAAHDILALGVTAPLGEGLVLEHDAREAGARVRAHGRRACRTADAERGPRRRIYGLLSHRTCYFRKLGAVYKCSTADL